MSRQIFPLENYPTGAGLTEEQREFNELWKALRAVQQGREDLPWISVGFKPTVQKDGPASRGRVKPFEPGRLIRKASEVTAVLLHRIPTRYWRGARQNRQFRFNLVECPIRLYEAEGELHIAPTELPEEEQSRLYVADLSMNPRQDGPVLAERSWAPDQLIPTSPEFTSPWSGSVRIEDGPLYRDVLVDRNVALRIPNEALESVEMTVEDGAVVREHDTLAVAVGKCCVGVPVLDSRGRAAIDRVAPPVVSATRKKPLLRLALRMLRSQVEGPERVTPPHEWAPRHLAEFNPDKFRAITAMPAWEETPALLQELCDACGPQGRLRLRFPASVSATYKGREGDVLQFELEDGTEATLPIPSSAVIAVETGGTVEPGGVLGDWAPPQRPWDPAGLREAVGDFWTTLVQSFLAHVAIRSGEEGYSGLGVLVPARFVRPVLSEAESLEWMDFRPCREYLTEDGAIAPPPIPQEDWRDMVFMLGEIGVDATPTGDRLTTQPIFERREAKKSPAK